MAFLRKAKHFCKPPTPTARRVRCITRRAIVARHEAARLDVGLQEYSPLLQECPTQFTGQLARYRALPASGSHTSSRKSRLTIGSTADNSADDGSPAPNSTGAAHPTSTVEDAPMASVETLPPRTSQTSANSGASKRVLSHGKQVVLNSDSDSDSMEELDFGVPAPKPSIPTYTGRPTRSRLAVEEPELRRPPKSARSVGKRSSNKLMETAQKNIETEREIQESTKALERSRADLKKMHEQPTLATTNIDKDTLKHALQDGNDSDGADRLYKAVQRTNEAQAQTVYHFFDQTPDLSLVSPFPHRSLPDHGWTVCFEGMYPAACYSTPLNFGQKHQLETMPSRLGLHNRSFACKNCPRSLPLG